MVVAGQQDVFLSAPVAAADVDAGTDPIDTVDDPIDQLGGVFEFGTRITAGSKGRSHERSPFTLLRHHHFG